jgi:hypothetical protein
MVRRVSDDVRLSEQCDVAPVLLHPPEIVGRSPRVDVTESRVEPAARMKHGSRRALDRSAGQREVRYQDRTRTPAEESDAEIPLPLPAAAS